MLARQWLDEDALSSDAALYLLNALKAPATPEAYRSALDEYALLEGRLQRDFGRLPSPEVAQLAATIRAELSRPSVRPAPAATPTIRLASPTGLERPVVNQRAAPRSRMTAIPLATFLLLASTSFTSHAARPEAVGSGRPSVAVVDIRNLSHDSRTAWLELGLPQMVSSDIARLPRVEVVSLERVRNAREALGLPQGAALRPSDIVRLGAHSGADWVVSGGVRRTGSLYVLDMTVLSTGGSNLPQRLTLTSSSLLALADQAATKLAALAATGDSGERQGSLSNNVLAGGLPVESEPASLRAQRR